MRTLYDLKLQCTFFISCAKSEGLLDSTKTATLKFRMILSQLTHRASSLALPFMKKMTNK